MDLVPVLVPVPHRRTVTLRKPNYDNRCKYTNDDVEGGLGDPALGFL